MKYRKMKERLAKAQAWWDKLPAKEQNSLTRSGSVKWR